MFRTSESEIGSFFSGFFQSLFLQKAGLFTTLGSRWVFFFFFLIHVLQCPSLVIFNQFFLTLVIASFSFFLSDANSTKGRVHLFCVPLHLKEKEKKKIIFVLRRTLASQICYYGTTERALSGGLETKSWWNEYHFISHYYLFFYASKSGWEGTSSRGDWILGNGWNRNRTSILTLRWELFWRLSLPFRTSCWCWTTSVVMYIKKWRNCMQIFASVDTRDLPLGGDTCNQPLSRVYSKKVDRDGKSAELSWSDYYNWVVAFTLGVRQGMQGVWKTIGRPHCNQETLEASDLRISISRSCGMEERCLSASMGPPRDICILSVHHHEKSANQGHDIRTPVDGSRGSSVFT